MAQSVRINVSMPIEMFRAMEDTRGDVSRSRFMQRALESALDTDGGVARSSSPQARTEGAHIPRPSPPASTRTPKKDRSLKDTWAQ